MSDYELKRINALTEASAINDSDVFAIDSAAGTKKVAWETLKGEVDADISEAVSNKADKDGTYPDMAVGSVLGTNSITDTEPYFLRPSASIGDREFDTLVGGTVARNQLVQNGNFADTSNWNISVYTLSAANNVLTVTIPETHGAHFQLYQSGLFATAGHKYLICANVKPSFAITSFQLRINANEIATEQSLTASVWNSFEKIFSASDGNTMPFTFRIGVSELQTGTVDLKTVNLIDLTQMFGSTIADYIYSLEQATAGAGVAWGRKYLPNDYYAYCAPTLKHVEGVSAHVMTGFNAWDEEWEVGGINDSTGANTTASDRIRSKNYISVMPNTTYYLNDSVNSRLFYYDANKTFISAPAVEGVPRTFTTPSNCHYVRFFSVGATYNHDICINLSGSRNGQYEPYETHSYPIDSTWVGMGIPKLDSSNKLYFDGDRYASDGTVTEKYGIVDLGTLTWNKSSSITNGFVAINGMPNDFPVAPNTGAIPNWLNSKGYTVVSNGDMDSAGDKRIAWRVYGMNKGVIVNDSAYSAIYESFDADAFKAAMSGVYLVYEKATPTTSTASPFTSPQICDKDGTEEYVTTGLVPVGHETEYVENLADKLTDIPDLPTTAGTYSLKVTVSGGVPSYSWVSA